MIALFLGPQDNILSALNQLINAANSLGASPPITLFSEPKANVAEGIGAFVKRANASGIVIARIPAPNANLVDALNSLINELNGIGGFTPTPTPTPTGTQMTWGDGTNVTSGDGTNETWSG